MCKVLWNFSFYDEGGFIIEITFRTFKRLYLEIILDLQKNWKIESSLYPSQYYANIYICITKVRMDFEECLGIYQISHIKKTFMNKTTEL